MDFKTFWIKNKLRYAQLAEFNVKLALHTVAEEVWGLLSDYYRFEASLSAYGRGFSDGHINGYAMAQQDLIKAVGNHRLDETRLLCDGDDCTLKELRDAYNDLSDTEKI